MVIYIHLRQRTNAFILNFPPKCIKNRTNSSVYMIYRLETCSRRKDSHGTVSDMGDGCLGGQMHS